MRQRRAASRPRSTARHVAWDGFAGVVAAGLLALLLALAACAPGAVSGTQSAGPQAAAAPHALTYVAIGASDAFGIGTDDPDRDAWPTLVAHRLGPGTHLINLGVPGATTALALQNELPIALDAHPDVVTVWLAVNDLAAGVALADYRAQLGTLLKGLRHGLPEARIVVGNIPDLTVLPHFSADDPATLRAEVQTWNAAIAADCAAAGVTLVDLYAEWSELADHPEYISGDGFHPSAIGAERLADLFSVALDLAAASSPSAGGTP
jgi:lysophospholipase L1-like esterase